jgi:hypothetical protein
MEAGVNLNEAGLPVPGFGPRGTAGLPDMYRDVPTG